MAITSIWPILKDWITNLPNRVNNRDYNLAEDMNEVRQFMLQSEQLMGDFTYGGGIATMFATAQNTPIMNVRIGGGSVWFGGSKVEKFAGPYTSPMVTAPIGNPRIDVLTMNTSGVFAWTVGTPAGSPAAPAYPTGKLPICEVYVPVGATRIVSTVEEATGADAYILNHRPIKPDMIVPGSGGHIFKDEGGAALTQRTYANFIGAHVTATDNSGADSTDITVDDLLTIASKSANYTATVDDRLLAFDCTSGNKTLTLYTASAHAGMWLYVIKTDVSVNTLTIDPNGAELINGAANLVLANQFDAALIYVNGTSWFVIARAGASGGSGGHIIQSNGVDQTARGHLNFKPTGLVSDDAGNDATIIDLSALTTGNAGAALAHNAVELATGNLTTTATSPATATGLVVNVTTNGGPVLLIFRCLARNSAGSGILDITRNGILIGNATDGLAYWESGQDILIAFTLIDEAVRGVPGTYQYQVKFWSGSAGTTTLYNNATPDYKINFQAQELPANLGGGGVALLYSYLASTDLHNGTAVVINTWTNVGPSHSFTVQNAGSKVEIIVSGNVDMSVAGAHIAKSALLIDGTTRYDLGGLRSGGTHLSEINILAGGEPLILDGLSAGAHTVQLQVFDDTGGSLYLRALTQPQAEFLRVTVIEHVSTGGFGAAAMMFGNLWGTVMGTSNTFFGFGQAELTDTVETNIMQTIPYNCEVSLFYVRHFGTQAGGGTSTFTIRKNGVDTAVVVTIPAGSTGNQRYGDTINKVNFSAGDEISIRGIRTSGGANVVGYSVMLKPI